MLEFAWALGFRTPLVSSPEFEQYKAGKSGGDPIIQFVGDLRQRPIGRDNRGLSGAQTTIEHLQCVPAFKVGQGAGAQVIEDQNAWSLVILQNRHFAIVLIVERTPDRLIQVRSPSELDVSSAEYDISQDGGRKVSLTASRATSKEKAVSRVCNPGSHSLGGSPGEIEEPGLVETLRQLRGDDLFESAFASTHSR